MLPSSSLIMDEDDISGIIGEDGNVFQGLKNWPYINHIDDNNNNPEQKIQQDLQTDVLDHDIKEQLESNVEILEKIDELIEANGDQMKIQSFFTSIQHIQRISAQKMLVRQNVNRTIDDFKHKAILFQECAQMIDEILFSLLNFKRIMQHVESGSKLSMLELEKLNKVKSSHAKSIDDQLEALKRVCVKIVLLFIYIYTLYHNNNNIYIETDFEQRTTTFHYSSS